MDHPDSADYSGPPSQRTATPATSHEHDKGFVLLRGGGRDGQRTHVAHGVTRLLTPSEAPGLLDIYEQASDTATDEQTGEQVTVFEMVDQQPSEGVAPELLHMPGHNAVPGGT